jgi:Holliday junction resolvasome RuvABC ATP-dependent DNA helicase subunit
MIEGFIKRTPKGREATPLAFKHLGLKSNSKKDLPLFDN